MFCVLGSTKMMCTSVNPKLNSTVVCKCEESDGSDIKWLKDDNLFSACSASSDYCIPEPPQYVLNYTKTGTVAYYNLTIRSYDYTYCGKYTCSDFSSPPVSADVSISIHGENYAIFSVFNLQFKIDFISNEIENGFNANGIKLSI